MTKRYYRPANRNHMRKPTNNLYAYALIIASLIMLYSVSAKACDGVYLKVGAGYKFQETDEILLTDGDTAKLDIHSPISARFEFGLKKGNFTYGAAHYSQWFVGWPVDKRKEYSRSEIFVDYKFDLFDL